MTDKTIDFIMYTYIVVLVIVAILWVVCMVKKMFIQAALLGAFVYVISSGLKLILKNNKN